jgi:hypothetical protein
MKLSQLAAKPQLVKVEITDEEVVKEFGEPLEFWVYDRQDMDKFIKLATLDYTSFGEVTALVKELLLDEEGKQIINDDVVLPTNVLMKAITTVIETLGKSVLTNTTPETAISK